MSTTWRNEQGEEWGKGVQTATTKGTEWGVYHRPPTEEVPTGQPEAPETIVEGFPCRHPGCAKVAKSAAGLAAHARNAH